jgi:hypothetical protein
MLIVEGKEDAAFFGALVKHLKMEHIQVEPIGGKNSLGDQLKLLVVTPGFSDVLASIGIVRDADDNPKGAFQSVCSALKSAELTVPKRPLSSSGSKPSVTVMILPDPNTTGMLEDVCLKAVESEAAMACVNDFFACLPQQGLSVPKDISKAKIQVYLAALQAELRLGEAAQKGLWAWEHPAFTEIKQFLQTIGPS